MAPFVRMKAGAEGREAVKTRKYLTEQDLEKHLDVHFPQKGVHYPTAPGRRALNHKEAGWWPAHLVWVHCSLSPSGLWSR